MRAGRLLIVVLAAGAAVAPIPASWIEQVYSQGLYARLQPVVTGASSLVPVALLDLAIAVVLTSGLALLVRRWQARGFARAAWRTLISTLVLAAIVYLWFLAFWGLNYRRIPLERKVAYDHARVTRQQALRLAREAVAQANALAVPSRGPFTEEDTLAASLHEVQRRLGSPQPVLVARPKASLFGWYFRQAAIDGMTNPLFLEIILHPDLLPFERPFVLAHEWAHLAGYASEAEANFVAWLTCVRGSASARYSGWVTAYQHLAGHLPPDDRRALRAELSDVVVSDLAAAARRASRSSPAVRTAARGAYDSYLRANRVDDGIASYGAVVQLMLGVTLDGAWSPQPVP